MVSWNPKQLLKNGCLVKQPFPMQRFGIIQLKQPFINGCLEFQVTIIPPHHWVGKISPMYPKEPGLFFVFIAHLASSVVGNHIQTHCESAQLESC